MTIGFSDEERALLAVLLERAAENLAAGAARMSMMMGGANPGGGRITPPKGDERTADKATRKRNLRRVAGLFRPYWRKLVWLTALIVAVGRARPGPRVPDARPDQQRPVGPPPRPELLDRRTSTCSSRAW